MVRSPLPTLAYQRPPGGQMLTRVGVAVSLDSAVTEAAPGAETAFAFRVENTGMVVDSIVLDVLGDAKEWAQAEPGTLNLLPGTSEQARVVFAPPRSAALPAGEVPFAVRAMSSEDPNGSAIEEGTVRVGAFTDLAADLVPKSGSGRRLARYKLVLENRGNEPDEVRISAEGPDGALSFRVKPEAATLRPGTATFIRVRAAPRKRFGKGPRKTLPFQVFALPAKAEPLTADGVMLQRQMMPQWLLPALAVAAVAAAALVALWFTLLNPAIEAAATHAVNDQAKQLTASAQRASRAAEQARTAAQQAGSATPDGGGSTPRPSSTPRASSTPKASSTPGSSHSPTPKPSGTPTAPGGQGGTTPPPASSPVSGHLQVDASPGGAGAFALDPYQIPQGRILTVSDIVLENPMGDSGLLQIRAGKTILFDFGLADFRSVDYHFVQALQFTPAAPLTLAVQCANAGGKHCTAGLSFSGAFHQ
jgi:hypothetical protein